MLIKKFARKNGQPHKTAKCTEIIKPDIEGKFNLIKSKHQGVLFRLKSVKSDEKSDHKLRGDASNFIPNLQDFRLTVLLSKSDDVKVLNEYVAQYVYERKLFQDGVITQEYDPETHDIKQFQLKLHDQMTT